MACATLRREVGWYAGEIGCDVVEVREVGCEAREVGAAADGSPDLVMANEAELVKRSELVLKTHTSMKMHLMLPQHLQPTRTQR
jgi:hypothetical protein